MIIISVQEVVFKPIEVDENADFILIILSLINSAYLFTTNKTDTSEWPYPFIACGQSSSRVSCLFGDQPTQLKTETF